MHIRFDITGTRPLLMKNPQGADPENDMVKEINRINAKRTRMTEDDRAMRNRLQWMVSIYLDERKRIAIPTANFRKCLIDAGKTVRKGTAMEQALSFADLSIPLAHDGPDDLNEMYADPRFTHRAMVNSNPSSGKKSMVPSVRPKFDEWAFTVNAVLLENVLDFDDLRWLAERAGLSNGLGDNRKNGFGRFSVVVKEVSSDKA